MLLHGLFEWLPCSRDEMRVQNVGDSFLSIILKSLSWTVLQSHPCIYILFDIFILSNLI